MSRVLSFRDSVSPGSSSAVPRLAIRWCLTGHEPSNARPYFLEDGPALRLPEGEQYPHVEDEYPYGVNSVGADMLQPDQLSCKYDDVRMMYVWCMLAVGRKMKPGMTREPAYSSTTDVDGAHLTRRNLSMSICSRAQGTSCCQDALKRSMDQHRLRSRGKNVGPARPVVQGGNRVICKYIGLPIP